MKRIAIVGASLAGLSAAEALRDGGFDGTITVVGDEPHRPYDRPPLSKELLAGTWDVDRVALRPDDHLDKLDLDWRLGRRAVSLDDCLHLDDGSAVEFDGLVVATGATPRTIPDTPLLDGIHTLRTLDDCLALRADLDAGPKVAVVGAGFIGAEVAATCHGRGLDVTVIEALPVPLERALGIEMGSACASLHSDHGVTVRYGVGVAGFEGWSRVEQVVMADGTAVTADVVVVGIGVAPVTGWLEGSGVELLNGVVCDATCASVSRPDVVAAGDVARWHNPLFGEDMRVEHWDNAVAQGRHAGRRLLEGPGIEPFAPVPYFWSDQYDAKIQFAGRLGDEVRVVDGSLEERKFVALYGRAGRLVGVLGVNRPRLVMQYRRRIGEGLPWEDALAGAAG
jgi:3-phenylpropionate/trans-cinnamate dioxygenase ferredoxin reductase subunit